MILAVMGLAHALECDHVKNMVGVNVPVAVVVRTIGGADVIAPDMVTCLRAARVAPEIVAAVEAREAALAAAPKRPTEADTREVGSDEPTEGAPPPDAAAAPDDAVAAAERMVRAEDYVGASRALHALRAAGNTSSKVLYWEARALEGMELHHAAERGFAALAARGPTDPYWEWSVPGLVRSTRDTGDRTAAADLAVTVPAEAWPRSSRNAYGYLLGVRRLEEGRLDEARAGLATVSTLSEHYARARFLEGIVYARQGKMKSAVRAFTDVVRADAAVDTPAELAEVERVRDHALLNIARIYYDIEQFAQAEEYYAKVPLSSDLQPQAVLEAGWCLFMQSDLNPLDRSLVTLERLEKRGGYLPEVGLLRALHHFQFSRHAEVARVFDAWDARWDPVRAELDAVVATYGKAGARHAELYLRYLVGQTRTALPEGLLARLRRDRDVATALAHLGVLDAEEARIRKLPAAWRAEVGDALLASYAADRAGLQERAGRALLDAMARQAPYLADLARKAEVLRFDIASVPDGPTASRSQAVERLRALLASEPDAKTRPEMAFRLATYGATPADRIPAYMAIVERYPDYPRADDVTWELALDLIVAGEPDRAREALRQLVERWPDSPHVEELKKAAGR